MIEVCTCADDAQRMLRDGGLWVELLETVGETCVLRVVDGQGRTVTVRTRSAGPGLVENVWCALDGAYTRGKT